MYEDKRTESQRQYITLFQTMGVIILMLPWIDLKTL